MDFYFGSSLRPWTVNHGQDRLLRSPRPAGPREGRKRLRRPRCLGAAAQAAQAERPLRPPRNTRQQGGERRRSGTVTKVCHPRFGGGPARLQPRLARLAAAEARRCRRSLPETLLVPRYPPYLWICSTRFRVVMATSACSGPSRVVAVLGPPLRVQLPLEGERLLPVPLARRRHA